MIKKYTVSILLLLNLLHLIPASGQTPSFTWVTQAGGSGTDEGHAIAVDTSGNTYITGLFSGTATFGGITLSGGAGTNIFIAKYDSSGNVVWAKWAGGSGDESGNGITVDSAGNVYVAGFFAGTTEFDSTELVSKGTNNIFVAKYDNSGNLIWVQQAGGTGARDEANSISLAPDGTLYVAGVYQGNATFGNITLTGSSVLEIFIAKYDDSGNVLWVTGAGGNCDSQGASAAAVDPVGNCCVAGRFRCTTQFGNTNLTSYGGENIFIAKYNTLGDLLWVRQAGSSGANNSIANGIAVDVAGNIYVTGRFTSPAKFDSITVVGGAGFGNFFVAKYDGQGNIQWVETSNGADDDNDEGAAAAVDSGNNVHVTGHFENTATFSSMAITSSGSLDIFAATYDSSGNLLWIKTAGGGSIDQGMGIATDPAGTTYVTGFFSKTATFDSSTLTSAGDRDIFITKIGEGGITALDPNPADPIAPRSLIDSNGNIVSDVDTLAAANELRNGVVADGVTKLILRVPSASSVTFSLSSAAGGTLSTLDGTSSGTSVTVAPVQDSEGRSWTFALYTAPSVSIPSVQIHAGSFTKQLSIISPAVILVHGIWSDASMWTKSGFAQALQGDGFSCLAFSYPNAVSFDPHTAPPANQPVMSLRIAIAVELSALRAQGIAATKVDVVAHSMGGDVTRAHIAMSGYENPSNYMQGDVHKLITVGTPHLGSCLANFLWAIKDVPIHLVLSDGKVVVIPFSALLAANDMPIGGAVQDLQNGSSAIGGLGSTAVACHAIIGENELSCTKLELNALLSLVSLDTIDLLLGSANDTIVAAPSQQGCISGAAADVVDGVVHADGPGCADTAEIGSGLIEARVSYLLQLATTDPAFSTFPAPFVGACGALSCVNFGSILREKEHPAMPGMASRVNTAVTNATTNSTSGVLAITSPSSGAAFAPGDTMTITAEATDGLSFSNVVFLVEPQTILTSGPAPWEVAFTIPEDWNGAHNVAVLGQASDGSLYGNEITVTVQPVAVLTNMEVSPQVLSFSYYSEQIALSVLGDYDDGIQRDLGSSAAGTTYTTLSGSNAVVGVDTNGVVMALGNGEETVIVVNGQLTNTVLARVTIQNYPPVLDTISNQTVFAGEVINIPVSATDPDTNAIILSVSPSLTFATFTDNGDRTGILHLTPTLSDTGSFELVVSAVDNGQPSLGAAQTITVTVGVSCQSTLNPTSANLTEKGGSESIRVTTHRSDCTWTAVSTNSFITIIAGSSGTGNGTVKYTVPGNTNGTEQIGTITIDGHTFNVTQAAGGCKFALSPKNTKFKASGGSSIVKVNSNLSDCDWTVVNNDGFITITAGTNDIGKGRISYTIASNTDTLARIGTMDIASEIFTVSQAAATCEFSLGATNASFSSTGGSSSVTVTANGTNCIWKAVVKGSFIKITSGTSGVGDGTVDYTVDANTKTASRNGTITIGKEKLTIMQSGWS